MSNYIGLRKDPRGYVVSLTPDVCKLPNGTPTPFPIYAQFSWAVREVPTVQFEGLPVTNENSRLSRVVGDEAGTGGGVTSLVNMGMCRPVASQTSPSLKVGGHPLVHATRGRMEMNCNGPDGPGNTLGAITWSTSAPTGVTVGPNGEITGVTNPPVAPETEEEKGWFGRAFDKVKDAASNMTLSDGAHLLLGAVSVIPGLGTVAGLADAALYAYEGDKVGVAFALASAVPGGKIIGVGLKMGGRVAKASLAAQRAGRVAGKALAVGSAVADPLGAAVGAALTRGAGAAYRGGRSLAARRAAALQARRSMNRRTPPRPAKEDGGRIEGGGQQTVCRRPDGAACRTDPVDTVSGRVLLDAVDVELPGPLPLRLERTWLTGMRVVGRFGAGWTSTLDAAVLVDRAAGSAVVRLPDGTAVRLVLPDPGGETHAREHGFRLRAETDEPAPERAAGDGQAGAAPLAADVFDGVAPATGDERRGDGQSGPPPVPAPSRRAVRQYRVAFDDGTSFVLRRAGAAYWPDAEQSGRVWSLARIEDAAGNAIVVEEDDRGHVQAIVDSAGRRLDVETDAAGRVVAVVGPDPNGRRQPVVLAQYAYDGAGRLASARDASGEPDRYHYDDGDRITARTFRGGARFHWHYQAFAHDGGLEFRCVRAWGETPDGRDGLLDYSFEYDLAAGTTHVTDTRGGVETLEWDAAGRVRRVTDPLGGVTATDYDPNTGARTAVTDALGHTTRFRYTPAGDLAEITAPDGAAWSLAYDENRRPVSFTDPTGAAWTRAYDPAGRLAEETDPTGAATAYRYNGRGLPTEITDALGQSVTLEWDAAGQLVAATDRTGATTRYRYDALGRLTLRTDAEGGETLFVYDAAGRLIRRTDRVAGQERGPERTTRFGYDAAGNVSSVTDPNGAVRRFAHDALFDQVVSVTQPSGAVTRYGYDAEGTLTGVTDATGREWTFGRDVLGRVAEEVDFTGRRLTYGYDAASRLVESADARGFVTRMTRDAAGRLTERVYAAGTDDETAETFSYEASGRLAEAANAAVAVGFAYDAVGRVVEEWQRLAGDTLAGTPLADGARQSVGSTYDVLGRRVARATPAGRDLAYQHDAEGRLTEVADALGPLVRTALDGLGRTKRRAIGSDIGNVPALVGLRSYTAFGELKEQRLVRDAGPGRVGLAEVFRRSYRHDESGQIAEIEDSRWAAGPAGPQPAVLAFRHDADGRLAASVYPDRGLAAYEADAAGNVPAAPVRLPRLPVSDAGAAGDSDRQRVVAVRVAEGWTLGYDADGNLVTKTDTSGRHGGAAWRYVYDAAGRLAEVWRGDGPNGLCVGRYGYDVLGRRVARETWAEDGSGVTERMVWDGDVPAERRRVTRPAAALATTTASSEVAVRTYAFQGFEPVALLDGAEAVAVVECDQVGQPRLAVNRVGALVWEGQFDAWGGEIAETGEIEVEIRFPGQTADGESGLRYNRFRYYDAESRAYAQADPAGLRGGLHAHGYVRQPLSWVDPLGLVCESVGSGTTALVRHPFADGASHLTTTSGLARFPTSPTYGGPSGLYVSPKGEIDDLLARSKSRKELEVMLGLNPGQLDSGDIVRIDIANPLERDLRLPDPATGNIYHRPGTGKTTGNITESVIDSPLKSDPLVTKTVLPDW